MKIGNNTNIVMFVFSWNKILTKSEVYELLIKHTFEFPKSIQITNKFTLNTINITVNTPKYIWDIWHVSGKIYFMYLNMIDIPQDDLSAYVSSIYYCKMLWMLWENLFALLKNEVLEMFEHR